MRYEETAKRIRTAMSNIGISAQELSNRSGVGKSSISHYVNGTNTPGNKKAYALSRVLCVNPLWLMGFDVPMESDAQSGPAAFVLTETEMKVIEAYRRCTPELKTALHGFLGIKGDADECETVEHSAV